MPLHSALSAGELTALAGPISVQAKLYYAPLNTETARINAPSGLTWPLDELPIDGLSANFLTNVKAGQTILIGSAAGAYDRGKYRVRLVPNSTTLFVQQMSAADPGLAALDMRSSAISDNDYVTVITSQFDFWTVAGVIVFDGETTEFFKDSDLAFDAQTGTKAPPIVNLGSHRAVRPDSGQTYATLSCTASVSLWTSSVSAYAWTTSPAWTNTSGDTTSAFSGRAPAGFSTVSCSVTLASGATFTATRLVWVDSASVNPPVPVRIESDTSTRDGWRMSVTLPDNLLASLPNGAFVHVRLYLNANGSESGVGSAVQQFSGWLITEGANTEPGLRTGNAEIVGPGELLRRMDNKSQLVDTAVTPAHWQQMSASLCKVRFFADYLLRWHAGNLLSLFDWTPDTTASTDDVLPQIEAPRGSVWNQVSALAERLFLSLTCDSAGALYLLKHPSRYAVADRGSIVERCTLDASKYRDLSTALRLRPETTAIEAWGQTYTNSAFTNYRSRAPGKVDGQGANEASVLNGLLVASQDALNGLSGLEYARLNAPYSFNLRIPRPWSVFEPAYLQFVRVQATAAQQARGVALDKRCILTQVTRQYDHEAGTLEVSLTLETETSGVPGETMPIPTETLTDDDWTNDDWTEEQIIEVIDPSGDDFDDDDDINPDDIIAGEYGRVPIVTSDGHVARWRGNGAGGAFSDVSPSAVLREALGAVIAARPDPFQPKRVVILGENGIIQTTDITATTPLWSVLALSGGGEAPLVTFDPGGALYRIVPPDEYQDVTQSLYAGFQSTSPVVEPTGGFDDTGRLAGPATTVASCDFVAGAWTYVACEVELPKPSHVTAYSMRGRTAAFDGNTQVMFFDSSYRLLHLDEQIDSITDSIWTTVSNAVDIKDVKYIWYTSRNCGATGLKYYLDDLTYTADTTSTGAGTLLADIQPALARKNTWYWMSQASGDVYLNRTTDNFRTTRSFRIAEYNAGDVTYGFGVHPHNANLVYASAGTTAAGTRGLYRSTDGGGSWTMEADLDARGGLPWPNWATETANTRNTSPNGNLRHFKGLDGSNDYRLVKGITGSPITVVAADATRYPETCFASYWLAKDLSYGVYAARTGHTYKTSNGGTTWSAGATVTGGGSMALRGVSQWPSDPTFALFYGYQALAYSLDSLGALTNLWSAYDTFRSGAWSSEGETIVSAWVDTSARWPKVVR